MAAQLRHTLGRRGQGQQAGPASAATAQGCGHPQAHVATAHQQHTFTAKAGGQRPEGGKV